LLNRRYTCGLTVYPAASQLAVFSPALFFIKQVGGSNQTPQQRFAKTCASAGFNDYLSSHRTQI
jgi:hypothetical protein